MGTTSAARLPATGVVLLLSLVISCLPAPAAAQFPVPEYDSQLGLRLTVEQPFVDVPYNGAITVMMLLEDVSGDAARTSPSSPGAPVSTHTTTIVIADYEPAIASLGWQVMLPPYHVTMSGDRRDVPIQISTTPSITSDEISILLLVTFTDTNSGVVKNYTVSLGAQVMPYERGMLNILTPPQKAGQFETATFRVRLSNEAVYPARFRVEATADKDGFTVVAPPNLFIPPREAREFSVYVRTPHGKLYEYGQTTAVSIKVYSLEGGAIYSTTSTVKVEGWYVSTPWIPLLLVGMVSGVILMRNQRERRELRRLEKGRPRRVQPTPRQAVLLAELKRTDPEAYREQKARLDALYKERLRKWRADRSDVRARDREEEKQARAEYKAAKIRQKEDKERLRAERKRHRQEEKARLKVERKAAKAQAKIDKKQAKVDAKEAKKRAKALEKTKKKLETARAKAAKAEAKAAKAEAKAAKKAAKAKGRDGNP